VHEPLDSHGSRCSAVAIAEPPVGEERWIDAAKPLKPVSRPFRLSAQPLELAARPIACCDNTSPRESIWRNTRRHTSTKWRVSSMSGRGKRWTSRRRRSDLASVLRRPVEVTCTLRPFRAQSDLGVPGRNPNAISCFPHATVNGRISSASVISARCRPSRIASTMSGASSVRRSPMRRRIALEKLKP